MLLVDLVGPGQEILPTDDAVGRIRLAVVDHDLTKIGQVGTNLEDLGQLLVVLHEDQLGVVVVDDVGAVRGQVGRVDSDRDRTRTDRPVVAKHPFQAGPAEDADPVALLGAERDQRLGDPVDPVTSLGPVDSDPLAALLDLERGSGRIRDADTLEQLVEGLILHGDLSGCSRPTPRAIIAPHAGYPYSGPTAADAFATLRGAQGIRRVVVIGPSHHVAFRGIALPDADAYRTPLGDLPLDSDGVESLAEFA